MTDSIAPLPVSTRFTEMTGCDYPVIVAPMFLVSNEDMVVAGSNAGAIGAAPSLNWRTPEDFEAAAVAIKSRTDRPFAVNIIVSKANPRVERDIETIVRHKVPMVITSLGNPKKVIDAVHAYGGKVFCDVTTLEYALKVQSLGADGVIAVSSGAGGHAGHISPMVLIPYLKQNLSIPIVAAGGIATGRQMLAAFVLGADAVQIGTRFIATTEAHVSEEYKQAILKAEPEDIVMTSRISGTPAAVINTPYIQKIGTDLSWFERTLRKYPATAKYAKMLRYLSGTKRLENAAQGVTWKTVWSAGQGVGFVKEVAPIENVLKTLIAEYREAKNSLQV